VTYVLSGALAHKDSLGTGAVILPGDVQRMSAGRGVRHSEFNHAPDAPTHLLQIWILPRAQGIEPSYEQKQFDVADKRGRLRLIASPDGRDGSVTIHADASIRAGLFDAGERAELPLDPQRKAYVHIVRGQLSVNGQVLAGGDAAKLSSESQLVLTDGQDAEVLVFDLAA
jgi:redox-sensitive bicupin YhaK (pirin superfamily)